MSSGGTPIFTESASSASLQDHRALIHLQTGKMLFGLFDLQTEKTSPRHTASQKIAGLPLDPT